MARPRLFTVKNDAMFLLSADQPVAWARPCTIISGANSHRADPNPMKMAARPAKTMPPVTTTRVPHFSATAPHVNCPTAYAAR